MAMDFFLCNTHAILKLGDRTKTISYDATKNLPILFTNSGVTKLCTLVQDSSFHDNLSSAQRSLLHWNLRLSHMDMETMNDFSRHGLLPKEISTCKSLLCPFLIQAKQQRCSFSSKATGGSIKSGHLKLVSKISCDQHDSREPGFIANNNGMFFLRIM